MDGQTLTEALHAHGINVRYIGKVSINVSGWYIYVQIWLIKYYHITMGKLNF